MEEIKEGGDCIINEAYINNNEIKNINNIYTVSKSTVLIEYENTLGTGFFIKFMKNNNIPLYCLMTSEHIINQEMIDNKKTIRIFYDNKKKDITIELNKEERIMRTFVLEMNIDSTIIEILQKDQIREEFFLSPCDEEDYEYEYKNLKDKKIQITQFPKGGNLSLSEGKILEIDLEGKY
jgi:hypothetical protein